MDVRAHADVWIEICVLWTFTSAAQVRAHLGKVVDITDAVRDNCYCGNTGEGDLFETAGVIAELVEYTPGEGAPLVEGEAA